MNVEEMFVQIAHDAPRPQPDGVRTALSAGRRARRAGMARTVFLSVAACLAVAGVGVFAVSDLGDSQVVPVVTAPDESREAQLYSTALRLLTADMREGGQAIPVLYVLDHKCRGVEGRPPPACERESLPAELRRQLIDQLAGLAAVEFVGDRGEAARDDDPSLGYDRGGAFVMLGPIAAAPAGAFDVPISIDLSRPMQASGMKGKGTVYRLEPAGEGWRPVPYPPSG